MFDQGLELDWDFDPLEALRRWPRDRRVLLLHSGRYDARWARWSILAEPMGTFRFAVDASGVGEGEWIDPKQSEPITVTPHGKPLAALRQLLSQSSDLFVGMLSYDLARWIERLPTRAAEDRSWPLIELGWCPGFLAYNLATKQWHACGRYRTGHFPDLPRLRPVRAEYAATTPTSATPREQFEQSVARAKAYIAAGDIFQVNLAQRFTSEIRGEYPLAPRALFDCLATLSPAWYGAYLELTNGRVIASTSPELFLQSDRDGRVVTRPIKGTRPVGAASAEDELRRSEKDIAELTMIVDLMRNDLGRVCDYGSVRVAQARAIESHPTVHHGVATIEGRLHESMDVGDLLRATIPGGSVTGAPKVRAMQIIDELEPVRRGPYCGCIGYVSRGGVCLNIAIRTMLMELAGRGAARVDFSVGAGIVADSDPAGEYQETLDKAAAMMRALRGREM